MSKPWLSINSSDYFTRLMDLRLAELEGKFNRTKEFSEAERNELQLMIKCREEIGKIESERRWQAFRDGA